MYGYTFIARLRMYLYMQSATYLYLTVLYGWGFALYLHRTTCSATCVHFMDIHHIQYADIILY